MAKNVDLQGMLEAVQVSKKMNDIIKSAHQEADQLRDDFLAMKDFRPLIMENEIFVSQASLFLSLFDTFEFRANKYVKKFFRVFVVIEGVTIYTNATGEELEAARRRDKQ